MLKLEEINILIQFCMTRPLNGLSLLEMQKVFPILQKLEQMKQEAMKDNADKRK